MRSNLAQLATHVQPTMPAWADFPQMRRRATSSIRWLPLLRKMRRRALPSRQNVLGQVLLVDGTPNLEGLCARLVRREMGVAMKVGARIAEGCLAQTHEARDVPLLNHLGIGVDVDREIEEIGDERNGLSIFGHPRRLQDVQPLDNENIGSIDHQDLAWKNVVVKVRIDGCLDVLLARLHFV